MQFEVRGRGARSIARWTIAAATGMGTIAALSGAAFATQKTLSGLPNTQQTQSEWCAITCAQNLLEYWGSSIQQCEEANYDFTRSDCCNYGAWTLPAQNGTCNPQTGSFTGKPLGYYGAHYLQWQDNTFSFSQFENEIDYGRPASVAWTWNGGGGHAMNVAGYDTSTTSLYIYDPLDGTACTSGDPCWMTYATYFGGSGYGHTAQAPLYDIYWAPVCNSDYFDLPGSEVQQCFDTWTHHGTEPVALASTWANGAVAYSGSYQAVSSGYYQFPGMTSSQWSSTFNTLAGEGYRPSVININEYNGAWQVDALFRPAEGGFYTYTGMSASSFNSTNSSLTSQGFVIEDLYGYSDTSGNAYFAATWVDTTPTNNYAEIGIAASSYQSLFNEWTSWGYYPARISAYNNGGTTDYAVIWEPSPSGGFYADNGASESSIQSLDNSVAGSGYHVSYVSALNNSFSGTFTLTP
jgi:Peptidase_C39 like family/Bacterial tandem repeat domain 1